MKIVLAYSGGLDTSVLVSWLKEHYSAEIITFAADVGQEEELDGLAEKAKATGASAHYTVDLVDEFARDFIYPMMRANAVYEGQYFLGTSIARPLIGKAHVEIAEREGADAVAHGATGKGNDQVRFELAYAALAPELQIISPWRMEVFRQAFPGRTEMINYCRENNIDVEASASKPYSMDRNLLHISYEAGILEDPWFDPTTDDNKAMYKLTTAPEDAPDQAEYVELDFERGDCVAVNGVAMNPAQVMKHLNKLAGKHGVGRVDLIENRFVGMKSRGVYETPGGTVLMEALRGLEELCYDRDTLHWRERVAHDFAKVIYEGTWFTPMREALWAGISSAARALNGDVRVRLFKGRATTVGRRSPNSLYSHDFATFGQDQVYDQRHAEGFIRLFAMPSRIRALLGLGPRVKGGAAR